MPYYRYTYIMIFITMFVQIDENSIISKFIYNLKTIYNNLITNNLKTKAICKEKNYSK